MKTALLLLSLFFCLSLTGQNFRLEGRIIDNENKGLPGAHISLQYPWGEEVKTAVADTNGNFLMEDVEQGGYKLVTTFLGFAANIQEVTVKADIQLAPIVLRAGALDLEEIEVKETVVTAQQLGDTTQYNADAFKTLPDANAEQLIEKMPGVVVENGQVQAQGEDVKEVLVDGRPFFGNDPRAALRNLPAEVIDKIQIFDQQSDQAQFTGFDDGETTKTINIITRPNMRNGQFGKVYAGYGSDERYQAGGNVSLFDGDTRISLIGQANNINQQNFATEDLIGITGSSGRRGRGGFGGRGPGGGRGGSRGGGGGSSPNDFLINQQGGIAATQAIGINYSDRWGKKFDVSGSYFFNRSEVLSEEDLRREFVDLEEVSEVYRETNTGFSENYNHRLNFRLEYTIDSANSLIMRPRLSLQQNQGNSTTFGETMLQSSLLNQSDNLFRSDYGAVNFNNNLTFRHRFPKRRRTFSVSLGTGYNDRIGESFLESNNQFFSQSRADTLNQFSELDSRGWNGSVSLAYTEPISQKGMLMLNYRASLRVDDSEKETFNFSEDSQEYDDLDETLTNIYTNDYLTQSIGAGYNLFLSRNFILMARANFQWAQLDGEELFPQEFAIERTFTNILPMLMLRLNFSRQENLRVFYRSSTQAPSIEQLQNVIDNSNPLQLSIGNPALDQAFTHRLFARYQKTNTEKSTVFFAMLSGSFTQDHLTNSVYLSETDNPIFEEIRLEQGAQLTQTTNLDGFVNLRSFITYGVPLKGIKSNLNLDLTGSYIRTPGLIDEQLNYSNNRTIGVGLTISSNISDQIDFTLTSRSNFNNVTNSLRSELNDRYLSQNSRFRLGWILPAGIVFRTELNHQLFDGLSADFDQSYLLWNMSLGKKLFKNQLGEIQFSVFDLLKQNQSISRNITEIYIEDNQTNVLQQYFMVNLIYNFRNFSTGKQARPRESERERRERWMRGGF